MNISEQELAEFRKYNYWRGFSVCAVAFLFPVIVIFVVVINNLVKAI